VTSLAIEPGGADASGTADSEKLSFTMQITALVKSNAS
jgi:hypothetical protein